VNENVAKAVSHPMRMAILMRLHKRVSSPSEIAAELGEPLNHVSYHFKRLVELKCAELVRTEMRRGAVEHYYRPIERPIIGEEDLEELPVSVRRGIADAILSQIAKDLAAAGADGGFERDGAHATNTPLVLDEEGWTDLGEALEDALHRFIGIQAAAANRLAAGGDPSANGNSDTFDANVSLLLFEKPERSRTSPPHRRG
jgi:DNA-binding transcriptional ArsR family regulator